MIGTTLDGRYRIVRKLGEGGMGNVFEATHTGTGRRVAVKVILDALADNDGTLARFEREARAAGSIESEHVAHILDFGRDPATGLSFLAMEFLEGEDLNELITRLGPIAPDLALRIVAQACQGLQKAHAASVIHRDIKPANIFAARRDEEAVSIKILDFGIAKLSATAAAPANQLTKTSSMLGTPLYMSPEQARGAKDIDHRTDLWSIGVVLYRLLSGRVPHEAAESVNELIYMLITNPVEPIQEVAPWVPPDVAELVHTALKTDRASRFQSATQMLDAIKRLTPEGRAIRQDMLVSLSGEARAKVAPVLRVTVGLANGRVSSFAREATHAAPSIPLPASGSTASTTGTPWTGSTASTTSGATTGGGAPPPRTSTALIAGGAVVAVAAIAFGAWWFVRPSAGQASTTASATPSSSDAAPAAAPVSTTIDEGRLGSFGALPSIVTSPTNPINDAKISLGRMLFYDDRLSKNRDVSCNSCHFLDKYGVDNKKLSTGDAQQVGTRNSLAIYNSAGFFALMWDGRAANVEEQAGMPLLNPLEMSSSAKRVEETLASIPGYVDAFGKAFPGDKAPVTFENVGRAIGAFERKLFTPSRWESFLAGEKTALTNDEKAGFNTFVETGCPTCHFGPSIGATMFQKLGLVKPWPNTQDRGRFELTQRNEDFMVFRVPSLRNVEKTGPYFHDGSITSLDEVVRTMARYQIGKELTDAQAASIITWLKALTGTLPSDYIKQPELPPNGPHTKAGD